MNFKSLNRYDIEIHYFFNCSVTYNDDSFIHDIRILEMVITNVWWTKNVNSTEDT